MLNFQTAGITFRGEAVHNLRPKGKVVFEAEPENEHDKKAIRIMWEGNNIGYVPAVGSVQKTVLGLLAKGEDINAFVLKYSYATKEGTKLNFNDNHEGVLSSVTISLDIKKTCGEKGIDMISFNEGISVNFKEIAHTYSFKGKKRSWILGLGTID